MKNKFALIFFVLIMPGLVSAQNIRLNFYGAGVYEIPYGDFRDVDINSSKGNANDGSSINLGFQLQTLNKIYAGLEAGYYKSGPRQQIANYDIYTSSYSFLLNISYYFHQNNFRPYVTLNAGLARVSLNVHTEFFEETSSIWAPLININLGSDMMVSGHTALFGFIRWSDAFIRNKKFDYNNFYTLSPDFNANTIGFGIGIKYWIL